MNKFLSAFLIFLFTLITYGQKKSIIFEPIDVNQTENSNVKNLITIKNQLIFTADLNNSNKKLLSLKNDSIIYLENDEKGEEIGVNYNTNLIKLNENKFLIETVKNNNNKLLISDGTEKQTKLLLEGFRLYKNVVSDDKLYSIIDFYNQNYPTILVSDGTQNGTILLKKTYELKIETINDLKVIDKEVSFLGKSSGKSLHYEIDHLNELHLINEFEDFEIIDYTKVDDIWFYILYDYEKVKVVKSKDNVIEDIIILDNRYSYSNSLSISDLGKDLYLIKTNFDNNNYLNQVFRFDIELNDFILIDNFNDQSNNILSFKEVFKFNGSTFLITSNTKTSKLYKIDGQNIEEISMIDILISNIILTKNHFYFISQNRNDGNNFLYKSDGTKNGTSIINEIGAVADYELTFLNDYIYFNKKDDLYGIELWKYNINSDDLKIAKNINFGNTGEVWGIYNVSNKLYFNGNGNKIYSTNGINNQYDLVNVQDGITYSRTSNFFSYNDSVIIKSIGNNKSTLVKFDPSTNESDLIVDRENDFIFYYYQQVGNKFYFLSDLIQKNQIYQNGLHFYNNETKNIDLVSSSDPISISNFRGLYELNQDYYYTTSGKNKGSIVKLNTSTNKSEVVFRFNETEYDSYEAKIIANLNNKLIVEYNNSLFEFDGKNVTHLVEGIGFEEWYTEKMNSANQPIINGKLLYLIPTDPEMNYELWSTDGKNHQNTGINVHTNSLLNFTTCGNNAYFINGNENYLYVTDGTYNGSDLIDTIDNSYTLQYNTLSCKNDKIFYIKEYFSDILTVFDKGEKEKFDIKLKDLPPIWLGYDYILDMKILDDKIFINMSNNYAGKEVFVANLSDIGINNLSTLDHVKPNSKNKSIQVFPNPVENFVNIKAEDKILEVSIYDITGRKQKVIKGNNSENLQINLMELPKGIFLMKTITTQGTSTNKIIKR